MTCPTHGATQEGLPCVWCWDRGPHLQRYVEPVARFIGGVTAVEAMRTETLRLERWLDVRRGREWRYWVPAGTLEAGGFLRRNLQQ